jgi:CRISPR-associated protein Cas1
MKKTIYIFSDGELKRRQNTLYFRSQKGQKYMPVEGIAEMMIFGEVEINKKLLELLSQKEILLHYFNHYGYYMGTFYPREHYNSGHMILKQAMHYEDKEKRLSLAKRFAEGALSNMRRVLAYYNSRGVNLSDTLSLMERFKEELLNQGSIQALMAIEGNAKEGYYKAFDRIIQDQDFAFGERTRRPPQNRLNALISFGNSLLYTTVLSEIYKTHLDPRIGFLHATNFRRFTLNLDVAEIFKPIIVDRAIFYLLNKGMVKLPHFDVHLQGIYLKEKGRAIFAEEFERRLATTIKLPSLGRKVSYRTIIRCELYKIEKHLLGEKEYTPFVAHW